MTISTVKATNKIFFIHPKVTIDNIVSFLFIIFLSYMLYLSFYYPELEDYNKQTDILIQENEAILSNSDIPETSKKEIIEAIKHQRNEIYPTILKILIPQRGPVGLVTKNSVD